MIADEVNYCSPICTVRNVFTITIIYKVFFSATKVYIDNVLTCRAWKRDSVARKSNFLRRNGAFVATRARVELVHSRGARQYGRGNLNARAYYMATPYLAWQPSATQLQIQGSTRGSRQWTLSFHFRVNRTNKLNNLIH